MNFLRYVYVLILNVALYFGLQVINIFVEFLLFGEGNESGKYSKWQSLFFAVLQMLILFFLYKKQIFIKNKLFLILNLLLVGCLYIYFVIYLPTVTTY